MANKTFKREYWTASDGDPDDLDKEDTIRRQSLRTVHTEMKKYTFSTINSEYTKKFQKDHNTEYSRYFLSKETITREILLNM